MRCPHCQGPADCQCEVSCRDGRWSVPGTNHTRTSYNISHFRNDFLKINFQLNTKKLCMPESQLFPEESYQW